MSAHAQFCLSGDHTLSATVHAINELTLVKISSFVKLHKFKHTVIKKFTSAKKSEKFVSLKNGERNYKNQNIKSQKEHQKYIKGSEHRKSTLK
jgi:hypothetical protein